MSFITSIFKMKFCILVGEIITEKYDVYRMIFI